MKKQGKLIVAVFSIVFSGQIFGQSINASLSREQATAIAVKAVGRLPYDHRQDIVVEQTNGVSVVCFPRYYFQGMNETNGPAKAAWIHIDDASGCILPIPGIDPLSDDEATNICLETDPDLSACFGETSWVRRASSLTIVSFGSTSLDEPLGTNSVASIDAECFIDTGTRTVLGIWVRTD